MNREARDSAGARDTAHAITDGTITIAFGLFDALVERVAPPIEAPDYVFHRDQMATFRWSAPAGLTAGTFRYFHGELRSAGEGRIRLTCELVDSDGIRCRMPSEHLTVGRARTIAIEVGYEMSPNTRATAWSTSSSTR